MIVAIGQRAKEQLAHDRRAGDQRDEEGGVLRQTWSGTHEYYTNEENHDPVDFTLVVAADGSMTVRGEPHD